MTAVRVGAPTRAATPSKNREPAPYDWDDVTRDHRVAERNVIAGSVKSNGSEPAPPSS